MFSVYLAIKDVKIEDLPASCREDVATVSKQLNHYAERAGFGVLRAGRLAHRERWMRGNTPFWLAKIVLKVYRILFEAAVRQKMLED